MKLLNIDLEASLPSVPPADVGEQWVLARFHGHPMGMLTLGRRHYGAEELRTVATRACAGNVLRHLIQDALLDGSGDLPGVDLEDLPTHCPRGAGEAHLMSFTVAVCTRNHADTIVECLDALTALSYPAHLLDLLIVDNAPSDDRTRDLIASRYPSFRYVVEPRPGLDWARNRAVLEARGEIIAFTDDDVSVDAAWVDALARVFAAEPEAMLVTGLVVPDELDAAPQLLFERYGGFGRGFNRRYYQVDRRGGEATAPKYGGAGRFGTGANMAFRRRLFDTVGLFDPALDVGTPTNGGGDLEMFFRVLKHGHLLIYEPSAIVRHRHRRSYADLRAQIANNGIGFFSYLVRSAGEFADERAAIVRLGAWWLWWWNVRRLAQSFVRPPAVPRDLMVAELIGSLRGLRTYRRSREHANRIAAQFGPQISQAS